MKLELFPTNVYQYQSPGNDKIKKEAINFYQSNKKLFDAGRKYLAPPAWADNLFTTFADKDFPIDVSVPAIQKTLDYFSDDYGCDITCSLSGFWLNVYEKDMRQSRHTHVPNHYSAIHFVEFDPEEHEPPTFFESNRLDIFENGKNYMVESNRTFVPKVSEGDVLIFPSTLEHSVSPNKSDKRRITISYNFMISSNPPDTIGTSW